jgi:hypothetical protein
MPGGSPASEMNGNADTVSTASGAVKSSNLRVSSWSSTEMRLA